MSVATIGQGAAEGVAADRPTFSVIVPSYARTEQAMACIGSLRAQRYPAERFEIVFVDDGSPETVTRTLRAAFADIGNLQYLQQSNAGPASARNAGAHRARGRFLVFLDDDCRAPPEWLEQADRACGEHPAAMVGGPIDNALTDQPCAQASQLLVDFLYRWFDPAHGRPRFFCSSNLIVPREDFFALGGFDVRFPLAAAEDRHFCLSWDHSGRPSVLAPRVRIDHHHSMTLSRYLRQHVNYGRGAYQLHRVQRADRQSAPRLESLRFYIGLIGFPWTRGGQRGRLRLSALLILAQVGNVWGYWRAARTARTGDGAGELPGRAGQRG